MTLSGKAHIAGVVGWPVAHTLSPRLHGFWIEQYGVDGAYVPLPVKPEHFQTVLRALPLMGLAGVNVTVPHKETALAAVDRADAQATRIGAVNMVTVAADGALEGSNSDGFGFLENLRAATTPNTARFDAKKGPALVLGAGGAARAVVAALIDAGAPEIRIANRTAERAEALAAAMGGGCRAVPWDSRAAMCAEIALLVNTTSLGMTGQAPLDMSLDALPADAVVNDVVYAPLETALLAAARARGNPAVDGLGMLLHQARPAFEAWFGIDPEVSPALRDYVLCDTGDD